MLKVADKKKFKLKKAEIELLRFMLRGKVIQEIEQGQIKPSNNAEFRRFMRNFCLFNPLMNQHERTNELNSMIDRVVCDHRWPICFLNTAQGRTVDDFFVFRQTNYTIIDDYFSDKIQSKIRRYDKKSNRSGTEIISGLPTTFINLEESFENVEQA